MTGVQTCALPILIVLKIVRLRIQIERARRKMYRAYREGNSAALLAASQALDKLLNQYEHSRREALKRAAGL